jgi:protein AATF/BFR2
LVSDLGISKSQLKGNDTLLKDSKYRGRSTSRKDLFEEPKILQDVSSDEGEGYHSEDEDDEDAMEDEESSDENESANLDEPMSESSESSNASDDGEDGEDIKDQHSRRDRVRQLLAQETK